MGSLSNIAETDFLSLYFTNTTMAKVGNATGLVGSSSTGSPGSLYISAHTAWPGETGTQTTSECAYTSYARVAVARTSGGWTVSGNTSSNAAQIAFPQCTGGTETIVCCGIGRSSTGADPLDWIVSLGTSIFAFTAATSDTITAPGHTFVTTTGLNKVQFYPVTGMTLPAGITEGTVYFVKTIATDTFTVSATDGGSTLDITGTGMGFAVGINTIAVANGVTPQFSIGQLTAKFD